MIKEKPSDIQIWTGIFIYTLITGLLIQLILLPYVFPGLHAGNGLLKGLDSVGFNKGVMESYRAIKSQGWSAWLIKPEGQVVIGIASIFYVLISPHPWAVLPLNAVLNASGGLALFKILLSFGASRKKTLISILPYVFFPTALLWNSQFHNDCYMVPGVLLFLLGWIRLAASENWFKWKIIIKGSLLIAIGSLLIWFVRDYALSVLSILSFIVLIAILGKLIYEIKIKRHSFKQVIIFIFLLSIIEGYLFFLPFLKISGQENKFTFEKTKVAAAFTSEQLPNKGQHQRFWNETPWLPGFIDNEVEKLIQTRRSAINITGSSNIDVDVKFTSTVAVIKYLPRAMEIGFLAPFPEQWTEKGTKEASYFMRLASGAEMFILYVCWIGLIPFFWKHKKTLLLYIVLIFCCGMILVYTIAVVNVGTLHRFRFSYLMSLASMGILGWFEIKVLLSKYIFTDKNKVVTQG